MLLRLADCRFPMPPADLFGRDGPLVLEIGFGDGGFLAHLAEAHPGWNLLGAEVSVGSVTRAFKRMRREGHRHVRLYLGQARFLLRNVVPPRTLHRVYVNFPDPWPKKRHHDRRLLRTPFFRLLSTRLDDGGALRFTTDHVEYFGFALDQARASGCFVVAQKPPPPPTLRTKYARRWRAQDKRIQHAVFTKATEANDAFPPTVATHDVMHHALLDGPLPHFDRFEKLVHAFDGGHVIVLEAFRAVADEGYVFVTRIEEEDLIQEVLVEARPSSKGRDDYLVGVKPFAQPLTTRGTKEAVRVVTEWLAAQGMTVSRRFY